MCGIFAICHPADQHGKRPKPFELKKAKQLSSLQSHRGPDFRGSYQNPVTGDILCHERLAIMDLGISQPIQGSTPDHQVIHNGEIYNHEKLRAGTLSDCPLHTHCDSEVIIFMYEKLRSGQLCNALDGIFGFALVHDEKFLVARDPIGVKPLYYGVDEEGRWMFSSEMKAIEKACRGQSLATFPPGHYFTPEEGFVRYYQPAWYDHLSATRPADLTAIRETLIEATIKRLMSDAPIAVLLSGGLDSSLVSSIAAREMKRLGRPIKSFSVGVDETSPDLIAARQVAKFLGTEHYELHFTIEDGIKNLRNLIYHLETYDITSIRASTPMYFLTKMIKQMGITVVLSGEGADEIFGGYLYFHHAPNDEEFQKETVRRVQLLSTADCLRADKSTMANAIEVRVPFLDKGFLDVAMNTIPAAKRPHSMNGRDVEKYILRKAFDVDDEPYLPSEILWRQKEQFSDGVGYSWIDRLMEYCASHVTDEQMTEAADRFPHNTPHSKEAYYMRSIFAEHFPSDRAAETVLKWIPKWQDNPDPSGRANKTHVQHKPTKISSKPHNAQASSSWVSQTITA